MAITKKEFSTGGYDELAAWMQANLVPGYFAAVSYSNGVITCADADGNTRLTMQTYANIHTYNVYIAAASYFTRSVQSINKANAAWMCANGAILDFGYWNDANVKSYVMITKTNNGQIAVILSGESQYVNALYTGVRCCAWGDETTGADFSFNPYSKNQTQLVPFGTNPALGTVSFTPNAFWIHTGQYYSMGLGAIYIDGANYLSNGYWAIKDA